MDKIDQQIQQSIIALEEYRHFLNKTVSSLAKKEFPGDLFHDEKVFNRFTGGRYQLSKVKHAIEKKIIPIQNRIFHLSLPLYLKDHDEPVWLDRDDTLEVIRWSIESLRNNPDDLVSGEQVLSYYYNSLGNLEKFIYSQNLFEKNSHTRIHLDIAPSFSLNPYPAYLFNFHPKDFHKEIVYYIKQPENTSKRYYLNKKEIDIFNIKRVVPGFAMQWAQSRRQRSLLRYLFPAEITLQGWQHYALDMILEEGFGDWDTDYHLLKLLNQLEIAQCALTEIEYYKGVSSREDSESVLISQVFTTKMRADEMLEIMESQFYSYTLAFIGFLELQSIVYEYKKNKSEEFDLSELHALILKEGIIPIHELKKVLYSL